MNPKNEALVEHLIIQGAIEPAGIDGNTGEMLYYITDKLKQVSPKIYEELDDQFKHNIMKIYNAGPSTMTWRINVGRE